MGKIISYGIREHRIASELGNEVCRMIDEGWEPHGSMMIQPGVYNERFKTTTPPRFFQPMIYRQKGDTND